MNWGLHIKRLRLEKGLTQGELSRKSGIGRSHLSRIELGHFQSHKQNDLASLARGLDMSSTKLSSIIYSETTENKTTTLSSLLSEAKELSEKLQILEIPIRGHIPAGLPANMDKTLGYLSIPTEQLDEGINRDNLFALRVDGESLIGDSIYNEDFLLVSPTKIIDDGKIYIIRMGDELVARHVVGFGNKYRLTSSNCEFAEIEVDDMEILGRLVLSGRWKKH